MQYFVQQALKNTTNAYLAYVTQEPRSFSTPQDFAQRAQLFSCDAGAGGEAQRRADKLLCE